MEALEELIIDLYVNQKLGQQECAKRAGVNFEKVVSILKKNGVHIRTPQEARQLAKELGRVRKVKPLQDWQKDKIIECYVNQKRGLGYTQKQAKCSKAQLDNFLAEQGIVKRTYGEAAVFSNQNRALGKDKEYFYHQSPNMAWILGFLASDGYVLTRENTIGWGLSAKDGEILGRSDDKTLMETSMFSHAELEAIESASKNKNLYGDLKGAIMYVSCEPCMMCMGAILYEEFSKVVYAATLQDSNDNYCPEMITNIDELAKYSKNKIEIVKELHRNKAIKVLKERGE